MEQSYFKYNLKSHSNIDDFFVGKSNINAFNMLIKNKLNNNNFLLIGPSKSGKTHLSSIWKKKYSAIYYDNNLDIILKQDCNVLIEDIFKNINEENIFHIINHCNNKKNNILITTSVSLNNHIFKFKDLSSRLKTFLNIKIDLPDDELLINLMLKLFHDKQIIVKNPEIFNYIIKRVDRSYENVFNLINKIDILLMKKNKQLTIPLIKELI
tara:strand:- start:268 stop:900 length:633 start_codon:yes stop_codon:yes gene_type:complete